MQFFFTAINILDSKNKIKLYFTLFFLIINFFFELIGIGILIPLFQLIFNDNNILDNTYLSFLKNYDFFGSQSNYFYVFLIFLFFQLKIFWSLFFYNFNTKLIKEINVEVGQKYFEGFMEMPYIYYTGFNSSKLIKNAYTDINYFSTTLYNYIVLINEILIFFGLTVFLFFYNYLMTIYCVVFFIIFFSLQSLFSKKIIRRIGQNRNLYLERIVKKLNEFFGNLISVKLGILDNYYKNLYYKINFNISLANQKIQFINNLPRICLEFCFILNFFIIYLFLEYKIINININTLSTIAVYFAFFLKVLPSANRISNSSQTIAHMMPVINDFYKKMKKFSSQKKIKSIKNKLVKFNNSILFIVKNYNYKKKNNFKLNKKIKIFKNKINLFYGKSGSGKTTFLNIIAGLLNPKNSYCLIDSDKKKKNIGFLKNEIYYLSQNINLIDGSIKDNITLGFKYNEKHSQRLENIIKMVNLKAFVKLLSKKLNTNIGEKGAKISGGQIQRIAIARALYSNKKILLFDEFTSALDKKNEIIILKILKKISKSKTIILSSHSNNVKKISDQIYFF